MSDLLELVKDCGEAGHEKGNVEAAIQEANSLKDLGFNTAAAEIMRRATLKGKLNRIAEYKYVVITDEKIRTFLERKAKSRPAPVARKMDRFDRFMSGFEGIDADFGWASDTTALNTEFARQLGESARRQMDMSSQSMFVFRSMEQTFADPVATTARQIGVSDGQGYMWTWNEVPVADYKAIPPKDVLLKMGEHIARGCFDSFTIASVEKIKDPLLLGRVNGVSDRRWFVQQWGEDVSLDDVI